MKETVFQLFNDAIEKFGSSPYTWDKTDNGYQAKTFHEIKDMAKDLAAGIIDLGMQKDNKIAILSEGRSFWVAGEYGLLYAGCVSVPLSIKLLPDEILFRINHSESKAILASRNTIEKILVIWGKIEAENFKIIYLDNTIDNVSEKCVKHGVDTKNDIVLFNDLMLKGKTLREKDESVLNDIEKNITEDDVVNICYTSGTTGNPKGIMLTQQNYYANSKDAIEHFNVPEKGKMFIILPLDHSFAHTVGTYASLVRGLSIFFVDARGGGVATLKNIPINLKEANPLFLLTVPALSGNFMNKMKEGVAAKGKFINGIFTAGVKAGMRIYKDGYRRAGFVTKCANFLPYLLAKSLIFGKLSQIFGNEVKFCVGGGALLDIMQQRFFYSIGVPIYQGYGLTEAAPIISANVPDCHKLGSSGKILPKLQCRIMKNESEEAKTGEKGEIVVKGKNVMKGYFKNPGATAEVLKDGWLWTGDLGYFDKDGFLIVVGREKALLISDDGEKYSPEEIEEAILNNSDIVSQIMIHNDHNKYTTALITLNDKLVEKHVKEMGVRDAESLLKEIHLSMFSFKEHKDYKDKFPSKWLPSSFVIIKEPFSEENHMINSTLKMVRYKIREAYQPKIDFMYTPDGSSYTNTENIAVLNDMFFK